MSLVSRRLGVPATSPIIPLVVGSETAALALSRTLLQAGFHVPAIRPPTVPPGTSRLRISLSAGHSMEQVEALCSAVLHALAALGSSSSSSTNDGGIRLQPLPHLQQTVGRQQQQQPWQQEEEEQKDDSRRGPQQASLLCRL